MTFAEMMAVRRALWGVVQSAPTWRCPLRCRHCASGSGPDGGGTADAQAVRRWVRSLSEAGPVKWIGVEGGEPFAALPQLRALLETAQECALSTCVLTNAFWAKSAPAAQAMLRSLPPIPFLLISADEFHEEFLPLDAVANAAAAGLEHAGAVGLQVCVTPGHEAFLDRLCAALGDDLLSRVELLTTPLQPSGRALETGVAPAPAPVEGLPDAACGLLSMPVLRPDGVMVACCQRQAVLHGPAALELGSLEECTASELLRRVNDDVYLQTLRAFGPKAVAEAALEHGWGWEPRGYGEGRICDLCRDLAAHPGVVEAFRSLHDTPQYRRELALARLMAYGEDVLDEAPRDGRR